ncbi:hypothetical protein CTI12_AA613110 [Artemisia annua]|uniref:Uncharacterized protein n=1 Tax=Artemisia annua TaxID=35608 RepID=A0A2U1KE55_ARTAN|nr:hypothetical protein CTI12_AA613110 [Artemisia annua]
MNANGRMQDTQSLLMMEGPKMTNISISWNFKIKTNKGIEGTAEQSILETVTDALDLTIDLEAIFQI